LQAVHRVVLAVTPRASRRSALHRQSCGCYSPASVTRARHKPVMPSRKR
jgi:hypothetical protein